jgi:predicted ATP-binding protein involved in virulence
MRLERLSLRDFRCFDELTIEFDPKLTVIIAENGAGKTAILDAIAIGFGRFLTKLPGISGRSFKPSDIRINNGDRSERFLMVQWEAKIEEDQSIVWSGGRRRHGSVSAASVLSALSSLPNNLFKYGYKQIDDFALHLVKADEDNSEYLLPVIAYYGTNRAIRDEVASRRGFKKQFVRFEALTGALDPDSRFRAAFEWFTAMEDQERREKESRRDFDYRQPELQLVRDAIVRMLPDGFMNPRTEIRPLRFVIDRQMPDGMTRTLRISQLSDGYRVVMGLVMDLARRMAQANSQISAPQMEDINPLDLPAVALIDEVDLHLHPAWQQHVLSDLMRTFPGTQFIVTTHSPQVLSTVKRENIRIIGADPHGKIIAARPLAMTYGEPSGDVLHSVMMVDPQPPVSEKADLQKLTEWIDLGSYDRPEAIDLMHKLSAALGAQHPQLQRLQRSIQRQEALKK